MVTLLALVADVVLPANLAVTHDGAGNSPRLRLTAYCGCCRAFHRGYLDAPPLPEVTDFVHRLPDGCPAAIYAGKRLALMPDPDPARVAEHRRVLAEYRREWAAWRREKGGRRKVEALPDVEPDRWSHPWL